VLAVETVDTGIRINGRDPGRLELHEPGQRSNRERCPDPRLRPLGAVLREHVFEVGLLLSSPCLSGAGQNLTPGGGRVARRVATEGPLDRHQVLEQWNAITDRTGAAYPRSMREELAGFAARASTTGPPAAH
jgi:hypothetical protein